ncbi:hypothetical protein [Floridanema evergladense]|uniref:Glycosyltransferase n=1 Tax=Floridaenema evergladense BLCC-F167 TaxID=3153639 RepID=A0ABV4WR47_9CYAN
MNKSCSIFFYEGYVGIAPTVINATKLLVRNGYSVNIYGRDNKYAEPGEMGEKVRIFYFREFSNKFELLSYMGLKKDSSGFKFIIYAIQCLIQVLKNSRASEQKKQINIGIDVYGSIAALLSFYLFKQKFLFLSLELRELNKFSSIIGSLAKLAYKKSAAAIVQDEDRFATLCEQYEYRHPKVFYLPNSPLNEPNSFTDENSANYFREKFNLSQERFPYIILQAGTIDEIFLSKPIAEAFASIDNGCALIFHEPFPKPLTHPYIKSIQSVNSKNLFISTDPVPYQEVDKIYASATICLALYQACDDNCSKIAMASGKLAHSLKMGKPVIVNDLPSLRELTEKYQFGFIIKEPFDPEEIKMAIEAIVNDYEMYSRNAKLCFEAEFDFEKKMEPILEFMENVE